MQELIDRIAAETGLDRDLAHRATSLIVGFISTNAPDEYVAVIRQHVPDFDDIAAAGAAQSQAGEAGGSGGGLFGALGGLMGGGGLAGALGSLMGGSESGGMAAVMAMVGDLQKNGLDLGQIQSLAGSLVGQLRQASGDEVVDRMLAELPGIGRFLS